MYCFDILTIQYLTRSLHIRIKVGWSEHYSCKHKGRSYRKSGLYHRININLGRQEVGQIKVLNIFKQKTCPILHSQLN